MKKFFITVIAAVFMTSCGFDPIHGENGEIREKKSTCASCKEAVSLSMSFAGNLRVKRLAG